MQKVLSLAPQSHIDLMFRPALWAQVRREFEVWQNPGPRHLAPEDVPEQMGACGAIITGWGAKLFSPQALEAAPGLKLVAHTAGSPRVLFSDDTVRQVLVPRGIAVYTGADGMARNVAEATIGLMILASRRWPLHEASYRELQLGGGDSPAPADPPNARDSVFLLGATVGLVSASKVARALLPLLAAFGCRVLIYDPFLNEEAARELGAQLCSLDEMFESSDIVSLHAPDLPATRGMVGRELLSKMRDGATLVNTSRGRVLDHDALAQECRTGRLFAALDVSEPEPLPASSPLWQMPNVLLLPHIAGTGRAGYDLIGQGALAAIRAAFAGERVAGAVPLHLWETVA